MESEQSRIKELLKMMADLGYNRFQLDVIIRDIVETTDLTTLKQPEAEELIDTLEGYVAFAVKCKKKKI